MKDIGNSNVLVQRFRREYKLELNPLLADNFVQVYQDSKCLLKHNRTMMLKVIDQANDNKALHAVNTQHSK